MACKAVQNLVTAWYSIFPIPTFPLHLADTPAQPRCSGSPNMPCSVWPHAFTHTAHPTSVTSPAPALALPGKQVLIFST